MASVTVRGCALCAVSLFNFAFVFISGADFIRFISFRAIYHNITGETTLCQGKTLRTFITDGGKKLRQTSVKVISVEVDQLLLSFSVMTSVVHEACRENK